MESPIIRLHPAEDSMSGNAGLWMWEIVLKKKTIASGMSSGTQELAYTAAREAGRPAVKARSPSRELECAAKIFTR